MPASSQQSPTSGRRWASWPHSPQAMTTSSIHGRCSSSRPSTPRSGALEQLLLRLDHRHVVLVAEVERQRQAPVALAADAPVAHVDEPVLHPLAVLARRPLHAPGGLDHGLADLLTADEPLVHEPVDQLRATAPADGVAVGDLAIGDQPRALTEVIDDRLRELGGEVAVQPAVLARERAGLVDRDQGREVLAAAELEVLLAAARGDVDDARALLHRHVLPRHHAVLEALLGRQLVERRGVGEPDEVGSTHLAEHPARDGARLEPVGRDVGNAGRGLHPHVVGIGAHRGGDVGRERPRRRRPHHQILAVAAVQRQAHVQRRVGQILVGVDQLVLAERRAAAGAPRHRAVAAVEPPALVTALEEGPDVADVRVGHRVVRPVPVHPLAEPL